MMKLTAEETLVLTHAADAILNLHKRHGIGTLRLIAHDIQQVLSDNGAPLGCDVDAEPIAAGDVDAVPERASAWDIFWAAHQRGKAWD